jgi:dihydrofolate reductase
LNGLPKYVVSSTLVNPDWKNTTILEGDVVNEVSKLRQELDGDIVVYASRQLVGTLMEHDLVDELRLIVYPFVLGAGERLFGETTDKKSIRLLNTRTIGDGLSYLAYEIVRTGAGDRRETPWGTAYRGRCPSTPNSPGRPLSPIDLIYV